MPDFDIGLRYFSGLPDGYLDDFRESLPTEDFDVSEQEVPPRPAMAMEWVVPTAVAIYIAKPFIDVVLKRAADDFADAVYPRFKNGIATLAKKLFLRERVQLTRVTSQGVTDAPHALYFSIESVTTTTKLVKFVFANVLTDEEYDACVAQAFDILEQHHASADGTDSLSSQIASLPDSRQTVIFLVYNSELDEWEVRDPMFESLNKQHGEDSAS
jgi:hypothetical protein